MVARTLGALWSCVSWVLRLALLVLAAPIVVVLVAIVSMAIVIAAVGAGPDRQDS